MADPIDVQELVRGVGQFNPVGQIMGGAQQGGQAIMQYLPMLLQMLQQQGPTQPGAGQFSMPAAQQPAIGLRGRMTGAK